jgi:hypothetical protein
MYTECNRMLKYSIIFIKILVHFLFTVGSVCRGLSLLCRGFRRTGKAMGQVYQSWWRICEETNVVVFFFFCTFEYHMFYILHPFLTYLLTLPRIMTRLQTGRLRNRGSNIESDKKYSSFLQTESGVHPVSNLSRGH